MAESGNIIRLCLSFLLLHILIKGNAGETTTEEIGTAITGIVYDPVIPILYRRLCITPVFTQRSGEFLNKIWLAETKTNDTSKNTIYKYEQPTKNEVGRHDFYDANQFIESFDTHSRNEIIFQVCIYNLTLKETQKNLFIWKIVSKVDNYSPENFKDYSFTIDAAEVTEAYNEINIVNTTFMPVTLMVEKDFCNSLNYTVINGYFMTELLFQVDDISQRYVLHTYKRKSIEDIGVTNTIEYTSIISPNGRTTITLDPSQSKNGTVCFRRPTKHIFMLKYFWRVTIQSSVDKYNMKLKLYPFTLPNADLSPTKSTDPFKSSLTVGAIIGIVIAAVVVLIIIVVVVVLKRKRTTKTSKSKKYEVANTNDVEKKQQELDDMESK